MGLAIIDPHSQKIMGLATIDPHSQKEHTKIHKIPEFGVNRASFDLVKTSPINTKLGDFVNPGELFLTMWTIIANPIIYRLVPSPLRYEIRQLLTTSKTLDMTSNEISHFDILAKNKTDYHCQIKDI